MLSHAAMIDGGPEIAWKMPLLSAKSAHLIRTA
jgi:hypothetical protein